MSDSERILELEAKIRELEEMTPVDPCRVENHFWTDEAVAILLISEVVSYNDGLYINMGIIHPGQKDDHVRVPQSQIEPLYREWIADKHFGEMKWCCKFHKKRPWPRIEQRMREVGSWDDEMEALEALPTPNL